MNIEDLKVRSDKPVSTRNLLHGNAVVTLMQVKEGGEVSEHQSKTPAMLILISGEVSYVEEHREVSLKKTLDFVEIKPHVTHKLVGKSDATLLLIQ